MTRKQWVGPLAVAAVVAMAGAVRAGETPSAKVAIEAPAPGVIQELRLPDGSRLYGRVEDVGADTFTFRTVSGRKLELGRGEAASLRKVEGSVEGGEFRPGDPTPTRLFFGPTARTLPKGRGYFGVYEILLPFVEFGVTDALTVGGGTPLIFGDDLDRVFWVTPKLRVFDAGKTQGAVGVLHAFAMEGDAAGIAYGAVTHGGSDGSVTAGAGFAYGGWDGERKPVLMLGLEKRVGRHTKLISENYRFPDGSGVGSAGIRFFGERLSADVALLVPFDDDGSDGVALPLVNFVWSF